MALMSTSGSSGHNQSISDVQKSVSHFSCSGVHSARLAVAHLIRRLCFEFLKDFERLLLCSEATHLGQTDFAKSQVECVNCTVLELYSSRSCC